VNKLVKPLFLTFAAVIVSVSASVVLAADPVIGTWRLNPTKTTPALAAVYKSQTRTYSQAGTGLTLVIKTVLADGKESTTQTTYQLDGKDYPVTGDPNYDSLSAKQIDASKAEFVLKRGGKQVGATDRTISRDGNTLTAKTKITTVSGPILEGNLIFDKQ
jgi:hypothetical protein